MSDKKVKSTKKETKEKEVVKKTTKERKKTLLNKQDQKVLKVLSKVVSIIAKVVKVIAMVALPFIFILLIIIPLVFNKMEINGNIVKFDAARFVLKEDYVTVSIADKTYLIADNVEHIDKIVNYLNNSSLNKLVLEIELTLFFAAVILTLNVYLFKYMEELFKNIYTNDTPFTEENCKYIRNIGRIMITTFGLCLLANIVLAFFEENMFNKGFTSYGIISTIVVYIIYYVFTYATNMQRTCKTTIYN